MPIMYVPVQEVLCKEEGIHLEAMVNLNGVKALQCIICQGFLWVER